MIILEQAPAGIIGCLYETEELMVYTVPDWRANAAPGSTYSDLRSTTRTNERSGEPLFPKHLVTGEWKPSREDAISALKKARDKRLKRLHAQIKRAEEKLQGLQALRDSLASEDFTVIYEKPCN